MIPSDENMNDIFVNGETFKMKDDILSFIYSIYYSMELELSNQQQIVFDNLLQGESTKRLAIAFSISEAKVLKIFNTCLNKIKYEYLHSLKELDYYRTKYENLKATIEVLNKNNVELKHQIKILKDEYLSEEKLKDAEVILGQEQLLCKNAKRLIKTPVHFLPLSVRVINVLANANIDKFIEVPLIPADRFQTLKKCGKKTIFEIETYLSQFSLRLGMNYGDVISILSKLKDEDISSENFAGLYKNKHIDKNLSIDELLDIYS